MKSPRAQIGEPGVCLDVASGMKVDVVDEIRLDEELLARGGMTQPKKGVVWLRYRRDCTSRRRITGQISWITLASGFFADSVRRT